MNQVDFAAAVEIVSDALVDPRFVAQSLPVLRLEKGWLSNKLLALYEDHLLVGTKYFGGPTLTEGDCYPAGESGLASKLSRSRRIAYSEIEVLTCFSASSKRSRLTIQAAGAKHTFSLPKADWRLPLELLFSRASPALEVATPISLLDRVGSVLLLLKLLIYPFILFSRWRFWLDQREYAEAYFRRAFFYIFVLDPLIMLGVLYAWHRIRHRSVWTVLDRIIAVAISLPMLLAVVRHCIFHAYKSDATFPSIVVGVILSSIYSAILFTPQFYFLYRVFSFSQTNPVDAKSFSHQLCDETPGRTILPAAITGFWKSRSPRQPHPAPPRSLPALGLALKIVGVCYFIAIHTPLLQPLVEVTYEINSPHVLATIWAVVYAPVPALVYLGYRFSLTPWDGQKSADGRRPILFLRPFTDDAAVSLQPNGNIASLCGLDRRPFSTFQQKWTLGEGKTNFSDLLTSYHPMRILRLLFNRAVDTSEESLATFFRALGPVRAIGRPGEFAPLPGADRRYVGADWQSHVEALLKESQIILIQPGITPGVAWELEKIRSFSEPGRILVCLVSFIHRPGDYDALRSLFRSALGAELPRVVPFLNRPCFVAFDPKWRTSLYPISYRCPLLWPLVGDAVDLQYTLQPFLQGLQGGEREPPRETKWSRPLQFYPAALGAAILGMVILIMVEVISANVISAVLPYSTSPTAEGDGREANPER